MNPYTITKLQKIIDNTDNKILDSVRIIFVLTLILIFGVLFYRYAIVSAPPQTQLRAEARTAASNQKQVQNPVQQSFAFNSQSSENNANGGDIEIKMPQQPPPEKQAIQNLDKGENSFYANTANTIMPTTILKNDNEPIISSEWLSGFSAKSIIAVDATDGTILAKKEIDKKLPIASVTKLMTALIVLENLDADEKIIISQKSIEADGEVGKLTAGEEFLTKDLLKIMLIASSNDAADAFTEHFAKKNIDLASAMNEKAKLLGMSNTNFVNPSGLDAKDHYSTAADLAKLGIYVLNNSAIREIISQKSAKIYSINTNTAHTIISTNQLLHQNIPEIAGGKTGYTANGRGCILSILDIDGQKIIAVVLGSENRFEETIQLISKIKNQISK